MNKKTDTHKNESNSWDMYWQGANKAGAFSDGGVNHPSIDAFWDTFFQNESKTTSESLNLIDIASGNGAVVDIASNYFPTQKLNVTSLDLSEAAIEQLKATHPYVNGVVCDVTTIPLPDGIANIVTSQFGIEYASNTAIEEAARLVKEGGSIVFLMHHKFGSIYNESSINLDAITGIHNAQLIPHAIAMFEGALHAMSTGDKTKYQEAANLFGPAIKALENIMRKHGKDVAGGFVFKLYNDLADIYEGIQNYDLNEVITWLNNLEMELSGYDSRMQSMINAAKEESEIQDICRRLTHLSFQVEIADGLFAPNSDKPLAWIIIASKIKSSGNNND